MKKVNKVYPSSNDITQVDSVVLIIELHGIKIHFIWIGYGLDVIVFLSPRTNMWLFITRFTGIEHKITFAKITCMLQLSCGWFAVILYPAVTNIISCAN